MASMPGSTSLSGDEVGPWQEWACSVGLGSGGGAMTLDGWFQLDAVTQTLFYKGDADSGASSATLDYALLVANGTDVHWATGWSGSGDPCDYLVVEDVLTPGTWHLPLQRRHRPVDRGRQWQRLRGAVHRRHLVRRRQRVRGLPGLSAYSAQLP